MQTEFIILIYFAFIIGIGIYSAFRIKKPADYYVAGKKAGLVSVSGSLLATILGGSAILGTIELSQKNGWTALWFLISAALGLFALIPISKYVRRYGNYTLPELLGTFYGKQAELISSIIIPIAWLGIVAAQIIASAKILSGLGYLPYQQAAIVSAIVFIVYTVLGGQLSILKTDTFQAILIILGLGALFVFTQQNAEIELSNSLRLSSLFDSSFSVVDLLILLLTYSITFVVGPDIYSRIFCAKNEKTAYKSILVVGLILIPMAFILSYLGIVSAEQNTDFVSFAANLLPTWAYGIFIAALLSAVMSSADTTLLTSSMIVSELVTGNLENRKSFRLTRWLIVLMGLASLVIALYVTSIIQALLLALSFFSGAFVVPTLSGLFNKRTNKNNAVLAILSGGILALIGKIITISGYELIGNLTIVAAYLVNATFLFTTTSIKINLQKD